jgi:hypothetical protein
MIAGVTGARGEIEGTNAVPRAWSEAQRRLRGQLGLTVLGSGRLGRNWAGHPTGAPYLVIRAETSLDRCHARSLLRDIAGVSDLMWAHGWSPRRLAGGLVVTDLKIFPGQQPLPVGIPS